MLFNAKIARISQMNKTKIHEAIARARKGISQYLEIMTLFPAVDVASDRDFQRKFNAFYRIRQRPKEWYEKYFHLMQLLKGGKPSFYDVLDQLHLAMGRYEPSFSSKLVATLDPEQPVWDKYVLENTHTKVPSYTSGKKFEQAKSAYESIQGWYRQFLLSDEGKAVIKEFEQVVPEHARITNLKKVDFVLWQTRTQ